MLQFNHLLEPLAGSDPAGRDLSFSSEVDAINLARQFDDPTLDQGEWVVALKEADWPFVFDKCQALLETQSKDLRIAGWLLEAASKTRHFEGMAAGFALLAGLCDRYWDVLHPVIEDGDVEQRVGNFAWLLSRAAVLAKEIPLTQGRETAYSWSDFESARARANTALRTGEPTPEHAKHPDLAVLETVRRKGSKAYYESLISSIQHTITAAVDFERAMDARLGQQGPSLTPLKDILATILSTAQRFGADVGLRTAAASSDDASPGSSPVNAPAGTPGHSGPVQNREHALQQLREVAEFFRRTEPHSPVAYLAAKAASWGDMPLHAWLKLVVKDPGSLAFIEELLDVKDPT